MSSHGRAQFQETALEISVFVMGLRSVLIDLGCISPLILSSLFFKDMEQ